MAKLDDFLGKKKEAGPILDLSKAIINSKEEFRRLYDKVPDFKMKSEKVRPEDVKIRDKDFKFKSGKKDLKAAKEPYLFADPLPPDMKGLKLDDLISVPIDWKMLTSIRPKSKLEEDYFSRLIELGKQELRTVASDKRAVELDPQIRKIKNKAGVVEIRVVSCKECGEEFCNGSIKCSDCKWLKTVELLAFSNIATIRRKACTKFSYDYFTRIPEQPVAMPAKLVSIDSIKDQKNIKKSNTKRKSRSKIKTRTKSKSPSKGRLNRKNRSKSKSPKKDKASYK